MNVVIRKVSSEKEIQQCLDIRKTVFVDGQKVPLNEEVDGKDKDSDHYLLLIDNQPAGVARVRYIADYAKIERVAVLDTYRGSGFGREIMKKILSDLRENNAMHAAKLSAQTYAIPFYEKLGFSVYGEEYMDANIPHKDMILTLYSAF